MKQIAVNGELKSQIVLNRLADFPVRLKESMWAGVRHARIHITDCRPYNLDLKERWVGTGNEYLFRREIQHHPTAGKMLKEHIAEFITECLLIDSPAERLARYVRFVGERGLVDVYDDEALDRTHQTLREKLNMRLKHALLFSARSAAAFGSALENRTPVEDTHDLFIYRHDERYRLIDALDKGHAFDRGNEAVVGVLEELRSDLGRQLDWLTHARAGGRPRLISVDSIASEYVRAADIAAGLAADLFRGESLVQVVRHFEYVSYNGSRLDEESAIGKARKMDSQQKLILQFET